MKKQLVNFLLEIVTVLFMIGCLSGCRSTQETKSGTSLQPPTNSPDERYYIVIREGGEKTFSLKPSIGTLVKIKTKPYPLKPNTVSVAGYINNVEVVTENFEIPIAKTAILKFKKGLTSVKIKLVKGYKIYCTVTETPSLSIPDGEYIDYEIESE